MTGREQGMDLNFSVYQKTFDETNSIHNGVIGLSLSADFYIIMRIVRGNMHIRINFTDVYINENNLLLIPPSTTRQVVSVSKRSQIEGVRFTRDFLKEIRLPFKTVRLIEYFTSQYSPVWTIGNHDRRIFHNLLSTLKEKAAAVKTHSYGRELLGLAFVTFLYEVAEFGKHQPTPLKLRLGRKELLVLNFIKLARKHYLTERSVGFYGEKLSVTSKYLSETTKEKIGKTAGQVLDDKIALEAKRQLEGSQLSISEIAFRLGFSTPALFTKFFKRMTKKSPRQFRLDAYK